MKFFLRHDGFDLPIRPGSMVLGRANDCQLVLSSSRVSRRHAVLTLTAAGLSVEDLKSSNGVLVNGDRIDRRTTLKAGDEIVIGDEALSVVTVRSSPDDMFRATLPGRLVETIAGSMQLPMADTDKPRVRVPKSTCAEPTASTDVLKLMTGVAEKMLNLGKHSEAERVLRPRLHQILSAARSNEHVPMGTAEEAARHAIKLAEVKNDPSWVEYAFELHTALCKPLPQDVIEQLYTLLRVIPPIRLEALRLYLRALDASSNRFPPGQRFLVKRIRGLEGLAAAR